MKKITLGILFASTISLFGCGGGVEGSGGPVPQESTTTVGGSAQKGPFVIGSSIVVSYLNDNGSTTTSNIQTETLNSIGNFNFTPDETGPVRIQAEGYHLNEITGELSAGELTLRAVYNITSEHDQAAFVNILTHLIHNRVLTLMTEGNNVNAAISQAQGELLQELSPVLEKPTDLLFTSLSVYNVDGSDIENNDYLLALSAIVYQTAMTTSADSSSSVDAELTLLLNNLSSDLADNGEIDQTEYIENLNQAKAQLDKDQIESNLIDTAIAATGSALEVPDIGGFLVGMIVTSPADEAAITDETTIRTLFPKSLSLSEGSLLIDGVSVIDNIEDLSAFSWNPYYWGDNNRHSLMVTAENEVAGQVISNLISVTVSDSVKQLLIQTTPINGAVLDQVNQTQLSWQALSDASSYEIQVSTNQNFLSDVITYTTAETSITAANLGTTTYYWRVRARNIFQWGPWTNQQSFSVMAPELPTLNKTEITQNESVYDLAFSWKDMGDGNTYKVYLKDLSSESQSVIEKSTTENSLIISGVDLGQYEWQLKRINSLWQESDLSNPQQIEAGTFTKYFGGSADDMTKQILPSKSGGYIVLASTSSSEISAAIDYNGDDWIFKVNEQGDMVWQYISNANGRDRFRDITEMSDGSIIIVGNDWDSNKAIALKLDSEGKKIWEVLYRPDGISERYDFIHVVEYNNTILVSGAEWGDGNCSSCVEVINNCLHEISTVDGSVFDPINIPTIPDDDIDVGSVSKLAVTNAGHLIISGSATTAGAYLQILDADYTQIMTWDSANKHTHLNVGDAIELSNGRFAIIGQGITGYIAISLINSNGSDFKSYSSRNEFYTNQSIIAGKNENFYGLFSDWGSDYLTFMSFNSNLVIDKQTYFSNFTEHAHPVGIVENTENSLTFAANEAQNNSTSHDIVLFKRGKTNPVF